MEVQIEEVDKERENIKHHSTGEHEMHMQSHQRNEKEKGKCKKAS